MKSHLTPGMPQNDETKQHQGITVQSTGQEIEREMQVMEEKGRYLPRPMAVGQLLQLGGECKGYVCMVSAEIPGCDPLLWVPGARTHVSMALPL